MTERIRDNSLESIIELDPKYHKALGQFIEAYATCEIYLYYLLQKFAKVSPQIGAAVFSGVRTEQSISFIQRIWQVEDPGENIRNELKEAMDQMKRINEARNDMVHYASDVYFGYGRIVSNETRALTPDKVREHRVSPELLAGMLQDCFRISATFAKHVNPDSYAASSEYLRHAWKYKSPSEHEASENKNRHKD
ncbi:MAG TPA: hypothetical protein VGO35_10785 [Gammaproteobacteria bacterium]|jgi:hypothetical protein|nr:hypothetical protein [Gammaproteobacteria bacterium]